MSSPRGEHNKTVNGRSYTSTFDHGMKAAEGMIKDFFKQLTERRPISGHSLITHFYL